ncbi:MAG: NAD-dependent epimerase [Cyanobacteria bacterium 13_1_20CM_4_61_6]|nr:MAG: NAD-dependent epimerase [Cyanobacteria bacterium 13_1_20CM_4_61_6]
MKVLLTGATGYIGGAVADALQKRGHEVIGLARSDEAASKLEAKGITAARGSLSDPQSVAAAARETDAVIHAAATGGPDAPQADRQTVEAIVNALEGTDKPFIYTSGVWVLGNTGEHVADEESALDPTPLVAWRPAVEQLALDAAKRGVRSIVIRPGVVYGRGGGMVADFIDSARRNGAARYIGTGENRWSLVHADDLADLYVRALENAPAGTLLMAASGPSMRVREIAERASRTAGADGRTESWPLDEAQARLGPYADALVLDQQVSAARARELLQWSPTAASLAEDLERGSYVANASSEK